MPGGPDTADGEAASPPPQLVTSGSVGFLDAPHSGAPELVAAVVAAFDRLGEGATLTVHSRRTDIETISIEMNREHRVTVIASIRHPDGGTTLTLNRW